MPKFYIRSSIYSKNIEGQLCSWNYLDTKDEQNSLMEHISEWEMQAVKYKEQTNILLDIVKCLREE